MGLDAVVLSLASKSSIKGKKALQKLVYFCNVMGISTGCSYRMYLYGPYSDYLAREYETLVAKNILTYSSNSFSVGSELNSVMVEKIDEIKKIEPQIESVIKLFGKMSALDLELYATVHFVAESFKTIYEKDDEEAVVQEVKSFKGDKFAEEKIRSSFKDLKEWGLLN